MKKNLQGGGYEPGPGHPVQRTSSLPHENLAQRSFSMKSANPAKASRLEDKSMPNFSETVIGKKKQIMSQTVKFIHKNGWIESDKCYVCSRIFEKIKGINQHHCRVCGNSICGECSEGKINERRVCDICMKREIDKTRETYRRHKLKAIYEEVMQGRLYLKELQHEFQNSKQFTKNEIEGKATQESSEQTKKEIYESQRERADHLYKRAKQKNEGLKKELQEEEDIMKTKEAKLKHIQMKTAALQLEITQKLTILENKNKELVACKNRKDRYFNSQDSILFNTESQESAQRTYSLATDGKNGKYNISNQPVLL